MFTTLPGSDVVVAQQCFIWCVDLSNEHSNERCINADIRNGNEVPCQHGFLINLGPPTHRPTHLPTPLPPPPPSHTHTHTHTHLPPTHTYTHRLDIFSALNRPPPDTWDGLLDIAGLYSSANSNSSDISYGICLDLGPMCKSNFYVMAIAASFIQSKGLSQVI